MQQVYSLRKISLILCAVLVFLGCNSKAEVGFSVTADGTSEGIRLYFNNIPEDAYSIFVSFLDLSKHDQNEEFATTQIYIWKNDLSNLKHSGYLICPFVKNGHEYAIMSF
jgi:hypothetical protein